LQNEQECIGLRYWHDIVIKDAIAKQVALNVTDRDTIIIVSSQSVLEVSLKKSHSEFQ